MALAGANRDDGVHIARLTARVAQAFPTLHLGTCRLEQSGGDHVLLIAENDLVFRFPRKGMHDLSLEIAVLQHLRSPVATPAYRYVAPDGRFAGYELLEGSALTPARFAALAAAGQAEVLTTMALFLTALHTLPPEAIAPPEQWPTAWTPAQYADRALAEYLPACARRMPDQARAIEAFYTRYRALPTPRRVVIHGDLVGEHLLLDEQSGKVSGIIDFSDVALGDAAQDLLGCWAYGADAVRRLVAHYALSATDPGLLARSHAHFIRYRLDHVCETIVGDAFDPVFAGTRIAELLADC